MADAIPHRPGTIGWIKALTLDMTGSPVAQITAPGGRGRASVRLALEDGRTLIATRRDQIERGESEAALLQVLSRADAPAPRVYGYRDGLLLQSDAGRERLSWRMSLAQGEERLALVKAAVDALEACRVAISAKTDLIRQLPGLGSRPGWSDGFVSRAVFLSGDLRIGAPQIDTDALSHAIQHAPERFTRWDARMGHAAVQPDGTVIWYDWEVFGRRGGVEDLAWLIADPGWRLDMAETAAVLASVPDLDGDKADYLRRMAVLIAATRLGVAHKCLKAQGWPVDVTEALRLDLPITTRDALVEHCARMATIAEEDPLVAGFAEWFKEAGEVLIQQPDASEAAVRSA